MTVGDLGARMSSAELTEWQAHFRLLHEERPQSGQVTTETPRVREFTSPEMHAAALDAALFGGRLED